MSKVTSKNVMAEVAQAEWTFRKNNRRFEVTAPDGRTIYVPVDEKDTKGIADARKALYSAGLHEAKVAADARRAEAKEIDALQKAGDNADAMRLLAERLAARRQTQDAQDVEREKAVDDEALDDPHYIPSSPLTDERITELFTKFGPKFTGPVVMTGDLASELLRRDFTDAEGDLSRNRDIDPKRVATYEAEILGGHFVASSQGVSTNPDWELQNGRHRLTAILNLHNRGLYAKPVVLEWARGEARTAMAVLDKGKARTTANVLTTHGYDNASRITPVGKLLIHFRNEPRAGWAKWGLTNIRDRELISVLNAHRDGLEFWIEAVYAARYSGSMATALVVAFYAIELANPSGHGKLIEFSDNFLSKDPREADDVVYPTLDILRTKTFGSAKAVAPRVLAMVLQSWNDWCLGRKRGGYANGAPYAARDYVFKENVPMPTPMEHPANEAAS